MYKESFFSVASTACWKYCCAWKISLAAFSSFGSTTNLLNNKYPKVPIAIAPTIPKSNFWFLATQSSVFEAVSLCRCWKFDMEKNIVEPYDSNNKAKGTIYKWKNHEDYPDVAIDYIILDSKVNGKKV